MKSSPAKGPGGAPARPAPPLPAALRAAGVALRAMTAADRPFLLALYAELRAEEMARLPWAPDRKAAFLADQFGLQAAHLAVHAPGADFWVVERRGRPIGRFYLDRTAAPWRVIDIGFLAAERGQGLGGALLAWTQGLAARAGAPGVDLHVTTDNPRARALYRRLGFRAVDPPAGDRQRLLWRPDDAPSTDGPN